MKKIILLSLVLALCMVAKVTKADFTFGEPVNLGLPINSLSGDWDPDISPDGLSLFFGSDRSGGSGSSDIWITTQQTSERMPEGYWGTPVNLGQMVNTVYFESDPCISGNGLSLFFRSDRPGGSGSSDIWVTMRPTKDDTWGTPINLGPTINSSGNDSDPSISADGLSLYLSTFHGPRPGGLGGDDIWITTRASTSDPWGEPTNLGPPVNTLYDDFMPCISADGLLLLFSSTRPGGYGGSMGDIWMTTRANIDDPWEEPVNLGPMVNTTDSEGDPSISADGSAMYFNSDSGNSVELWQVPIDPVVDLNSDGIVDATDMVIMVDHWGTDNSLCDIGPMPWGDGVVDVQDLIVLAEHLFEEFPLAQ